LGNGASMGGCVQCESCMSCVDSSSINRYSCGVLMLPFVCLCSRTLERQYEILGAGHAERRVRQKTCMSVCLHTCMSAYLYDCMSVCLYVCMLVCLFVCMPVSFFVCMSVCLYAYMSVGLYCMSGCLYVCNADVYCVPGT
jgi:hypothetical protein